MRAWPAVGVAASGEPRRHDKGDEFVSLHDHP
jgi:hypothetical protein